MPAHPRPPIAVVYLAYGPYGPGPVQRFADSYMRYRFGCAHDLVIAAKDCNAEMRQFVEALQVPAWGLEVGGNFDIGSYFEVVRSTPYEHFLFLNTGSEILCDDWLKHLYDHVMQPGVGAVGCTGSWESQATAWGGSGYPQFPNPHLRSSAFMVSRETMLSLEGPMTSKADAHRFESGNTGLSHRLRQAGRKLLVADRTGRAYEPQDWPGSRTYRSAQQEGLMIADNRTRDYAQADPVKREWLSRLAWGNSAKW